MTDDILTEAMRKASQEIAERLDYEIRGAWRAGYDYLHLYQRDVPRYQRDFSALHFGHAVLPSNREQPPSHPLDAYRYVETFVLDGLEDIDRD